MGKTSRIIKPIEKSNGIIPSTKASYTNSNTVIFISGPKFISRPTIKSRITPRKKGKTEPIIMSTRDLTPIKMKRLKITPMANYYSKIYIHDVIRLNYVQKV